MKTVLSARGLRVKLGGRAVVEGVDLDIAQPEIVALLGPNGSGKTTLLRALSGLLPAAAGSIELDHRSLDAWRPRLRAQRIAYLPQQPPRTFAYSVREFVDFGRAPYQSMLSASSDRRLVDAVLRDFQLDAVAGTPITALSGGEQQLVRIARAVVQEADIVVLDEPGAALDLGHQALLSNLMHRMRRMGKSIVFSTHDPTFAMRLCDRVALLRAGRLTMAPVSAASITAEHLSFVYGTGIRLLHAPEIGAVCVLD